MDRQLAERMVGAACLLAVLVLVVPVILDGNPDSGATITHPAAEESLNLRSHTLRLNRTEGDPPVPTAGRVAVSAPPSARPAPEPVTESAPQLSTAPEAVPDRGADTRAGAVSEAGAVTKPEPLPVQPAAASGGAAVRPPPAREGVRPLAQEALTGNDGWFVQLGSFSRRDNADHLVADLQRKGFNASVLGGGGASGTLFRVRAGPEPDRAAADKLAGRLGAAGFAGGRVGRQ